MNREILFRGFRECESGGTVIKVDGVGKRGEWVYGNLVKDLSGSFIVYQENKDDTWRIEEIIPSTAGQFTGLCDKNGKRIFEGDIVKIPAYRGGKCKSIVYFKDGKFAINGSNYNYKDIKSKVTEVISNVWEADIIDN